MVRDALREIDAYMDLSAFDDDGPDGIPGSGDDDGRIDLLVVLHPEVGFEVDPDPSQRDRAILAHQYDIEPDPVLVESGTIGEAYVAASALGPLGVWVHEIGHLLGLEDLYDVDVRGTLVDEPHRGGLGLWSLMSHGTWGGEGERPSNLDAISRRRLGWEDRPYVVSQAASLVLDPVRGEDAESVELRPLGEWEREVFVLEHRRRRDGVVDGDLPGSGVLVYRVDDALRRNARSEGYWVELLQADGRRDLEELVNNGDATDPFTGEAGADLVGPFTNPSSDSRLPTSAKEPPVLRIAPQQSDGAHRVDLTLSESAALRLTGAFFLDGNQNQRTYLRRGETADWNLRFASVGVDPASARLGVTALDTRIEIELEQDPVDLVLRDGWWVPESSVTLRDTDPVSSPTDAVLRVSLDVDDRPAREIDVGLPIRDGPGLSGDDFGAWVPAVLAAPEDTTMFTRMSISDLPLPAESGWETTTRGEPGYASSVEITLTGPWFAIPRDGEMEFWSRHETDPSQAGQAWDGGLIEIYRPDHGWSPLVPRGGPTVLINHHSQANTRGEVGLGGPAIDWEGYRAELPAFPAPTRVRLRFASDHRDEGRGWAVAALGTEPSPGRATIRIFRGPLGELLAEASFEGDFQRVSTVRFYYRRPVDTDWSPASPPVTLTFDLQTVVTAIDLPQRQGALRVGIFAEPVGLAPPLLLGSIGYRSESSETAQLQARPNPARGKVILELTPASETQLVEVYDLRGRRVRSLQVSPHFSRVEWTGVDDHGQRVAAGQYVAVLVSSESKVRSSFVYVP
jgi:M6 family metalloprotease-like protein